MRTIIIIVVLGITGMVLGIEMSTMLNVNEDTTEHAMALGMFWGTLFSIIDRRVRAVEG